jgi:hypothetical protein
VDAGFVTDDWLVPDIIPGMNAAMTIKKMISTIAMTPHPRKDFQPFFLTG